MERFKAQEQAESTRSPLLRAVRSRVAMAMIGLMSATACKASLDIDIRTPDSTRASAVDRDGLKVITVLEAGAVILLEKSEKNEKTRIEGFIHLSDSSPIHAPSQTIREYDMPEEARPWTRLVVEPSGRLILKAEGNQIALLFECKDLAAARITSCTGHEGKPKELDAEIAAEQQKYEEGRLKASEDAGADTTKATPSDSDIELSILMQLRHAVERLSESDQQKLARDLTRAYPKWKKEVDDTIDKQKETCGEVATKKLECHNYPGEFANIIQDLLAAKPELRARVAKQLGVTLHDPRFIDDGAPQPELDAGKADTGAVTSGSLADKTYLVSPEVKAKLEQLKPAIGGMKWQDKQDLARDLASAKPEWKQYVETEIGGISQSPLGDLAKLNLDSTILHLLALQPDKIDLAAAALGVTF